MGDFANEYAVNLLPTLIVFTVMGLPTFGYFYNKLMDQLQWRTEHTSLYVAIGEFAIIVFIALFSWKAALLSFAGNALAGVIMIVGEFKRTEAKKQQSKTLRRKRLPYAASGCIEDAHDAVKEAQRQLGLAFKANGENVKSALPMAQASHELSLALTKLMELKNIQNS
jgi:hypothetical protein